MIRRAQSRDRFRLIQYDTVALAGIRADPDPSFANVTLLLHCNGTNGSTTFTDVKGHTVTPSGNAQISTAQSKFGGASGLFDGSGDFLTIPTSTDYDLGTSYTVEFWARPITVSGNAGLIHRGFYNIVLATWDGLAFSIRQLSGTTIRFYFYGVSGATEQYIDATSALAADTWVHIAMVRNGTNGAVYINGVQSGTIAGLNTPAASSQTLRIGVWDHSISAEYFNGYLDDIRITKGVARYTANFTPPSAAFPDI